MISATISHRLRRTLSFKACCRCFAVESSKTDATVYKSANWVPPYRRKKLKRKQETLPLLQNIHDGIVAVRKLAWSKMNESVDISLRLNVDPRKQNEMIRGTTILPNGTGNKIRILVFAKDQDAEVARKAGADVVGEEELVNKIMQAGNLNFLANELHGEIDRCLSTPELMAKVGKLGKILGPRGLMPNPKLKTVTKDLASAIKIAKAGQIQFRVDKDSNLNVGPLGKLKTHKDEEILENVKAFLQSLGELKPVHLKGKFITKAYLSSTMGQSVNLNVPNIDPHSPQFFLSPTDMMST